MREVMVVATRQGVQQLNPGLKSNEERRDNSEPIRMSSDREMDGSIPCEVNESSTAMESFVEKSEDRC